MSEQPRLYLSMSQVRMSRGSGVVYMKRQKILLVIGVVVILAVLLFLAVACEPMATFKIENDTDQTLNVFVAASALDRVDISDPRIPAGPVEPGEILRFKGIPHTSFNTFLIEARDAQGNLVYSQEFKLQELEKANWKIMIPASR